MRLLAEGGLWSVLIIAGFALAYIRAFNGRRFYYITVMALSVLTILGSQFLPDESVFRQKTAQSLSFWFWALVVLCPIAAYAWGIRYLHKVARRKRNDP